jgi:hypothetical protein
MNRADQDAPEYFNAGTDFLADDEVPETLVAVLRVLAEDFVPETLAAAEHINSWLDKNQPEAGSAAVGRLAQAMGTTEFNLRGEAITVLAQPHRFYLLQRVQDTYAALSVDHKASVDTILADCGMTSILGAKLDRRIVRSDNLEVWD